MGFEVQKITGNTKTEISLDNINFDSMLFANSHATATVTIDLYITDQTGTNVTDTTSAVNLVAGYKWTTSSQTIVIDGGTFTDATCDYNNDPTIAHDDDDGAIKVGMVVSGTGIPTGSTVASVTSDTSFELSASTTGGSVTNGTLTFLSGDILNEKVYKSDGTFIGTCTALDSTTSITFSGGIEKDLANNDDLYTGTRFYILKNVIIPNGVSLKLSTDEINFNNNNFKLYILSDHVNGGIDITTRY